MTVTLAGVFPAALASAGGGRTHGPRKRKMSQNGTN